MEPSVLKSRSSDLLESNERSASLACHGGDGNSVNNTNMEPKTFKMPESSLLARLQAFLPELKEANDKMETDIIKGNGERYNVEVFESDQESNKEGLFEDEEVLSDSELPSKTADQSLHPHSKVVEMNFALGVFDEGQTTAQLDTLTLPTDKRSSPPRKTKGPLIQELS